MDTGNSATDFQDQILPHVSRTFALTIPQLPARLRVAVTNAYLLCRIADTIEDEPTLSAEETRVFLQRFTGVVRGTEPAAPLAREIVRHLSERTLPAEHQLVSGMERLALREVARQIGAFDFLSKPFVVSELVDTVRRSVETT